MCITSHHTHGVLGGLLPPPPVPSLLLLGILSVGRLAELRCFRPIRYPCGHTHAHTTRRLTGTQGVTTDDRRRRPFDESRASDTANVA